LPTELKTAKVVVIGKPGKKDLSNPKSYRCISLLSKIAKLIEKTAAQYLTLAWILDWLSDRSIALSIDGIQSQQQSSRFGIPQRSLLSPVLFGLVCAATLNGLPSGASYVHDCSWAIPFSSPQQLQRESHRLLDAVKDRFEMHGLSLETGKLEVAFISKHTLTSKQFKIESKRWKVNGAGNYERYRIQQDG
jgi:hypothetical protein